MSLNFRVSSKDLVQIQEELEHSCRFHVFISNVSLSRNYCSSFDASEYGGILLHTPNARIIHKGISYYNLFELFSGKARLAREFEIRVTNSTRREILQCDEELPPLEMHAAANQENDRCRGQFSASVWKLEEAILRAELFDDYAIVGGDTDSLASRDCAGEID